MIDGMSTRTVKIARDYAAPMQGRFDPLLMGAVLGLLAIGVVMVYSSSSVVALTSYGDASYFMKRQIVWALLGVLVMMAMMRLDHEKLRNKRVVAILLVVTIALLAAVLVPGVGRSINGARRWIRFGPLSLQPAELMKFTLIVYLSSYIGAKGERIRNFSHGLVPALLMSGLFLGLTLVQPDFGTVVAVGIVLFAMLFAGGAKVVHLAGLAVLALPLGVLAVATRAYRLRRLMSFLDPWADPQGAGHQIVQSFLAFGSGGVLGRGLGEGRQKLLFLPERHSDFIFAVIGEELGIVGALIVLALFGMILWRGIAIARNTRGTSRMLALGFTLLITVQALFNMAVVTGILPTKGIALPLVSYGGSALVVSLASVGVLLNISRTCA
jgi:cell division protein FtsW